MKVRALVTIEDLRPGEEGDLPSDRARPLIDAGLVVEVGGSQRKAVEKKKEADNDGQ